MIAPAAVLFAVGGDAPPPSARNDVDIVAEQAAACCSEILATAPIPFAPVGQSIISPPAGQLVSASRWRVIDPDTRRVLPAGVADEDGLQVRTILLARSISALFPTIVNIGGVRPDSMPWHPAGLALDVMIPNPTSPGGIALGNHIVAFVLANTSRFGLEHVIWRGVFFTPKGPQGGAYGHYDHVHIATTGGGYPDGDETYYG